MFTTMAESIADASKIVSLAYVQLKNLCFKYVRLYNSDWSHCVDRMTLVIVEDGKIDAGEYDL